MSEMRLHDPVGNKLYLNAEERAVFLAAARRQPARDRTLYETLHFSGCRPSELLEVTPARVDLSGGTIGLRSLKRRRDASGQQRIVFRVVPVSPDCLDSLNTALGIREAQKSRKSSTAPIWPLARVRVWQIVKRPLIEAGIPDAPHRSPKAPRHGVGIKQYSAAHASDAYGACAAQHDGDLRRWGRQGRAGHRSTNVGEGRCI